MSSKSKSNLLLSISLMFLLAVSVASCSKNNDLSNEVELVIASKPMIIEGQNALIVRQLTINNS